MLTTLFTLCVCAYMCAHICVYLHRLIIMYVASCVVVNHKSFTVPKWGYKLFNYARVEFLATSPAINCMMSLSQYHTYTYNAVCTVVRTHSPSDGQVIAQRLLPGKCDCARSIDNRIHLKHCLLKDYHSHSTCK